MGNKVALLAVLSFYLLVCANLNHAYACSPAPWSFEEAYESKAMVYGKVIDTSNDGRKATVDVISYAGPDEPPKRIHMPETVDDRNKYPAGYECPDFSMKFKTGEEYIFFLSDIPPNLQLLSPSYRTGSLVEDGRVVVGLPRGETDSLQRRLHHFAEYKGYTIQSPKDASPVWGADTRLFWLLSAVIALGTIFGLVFFYRK
ncbi:hypothetical protein [Paenibacillus alkalitolerans]|uniref:hypothetical protein n=1 Tax=Paenibacillus alkalitolerans TaxID=2799335 RepID=UPI0018F48F91|nr:hypothetical protein [Paenibacillus alkalitolerans]